jgi:hypothetical protein
MLINSLQQYEVQFLPDDSFILAEVSSQFETWQQRSPQQRATLTQMLHDAEVGEDWWEEDTWSDVSFTREEIQSFSGHILVAGDDGLPEWYTNPPLNRAEL